MSLFSLAIILIIVVTLLIEISRGVRRGFTKSAVTLCVIILSIVTSALLIVPVSKAISGAVVKVVLNMGALQSVFEQFKSLNVIIEAYLAAIMSPILFLIFFWILRLFYALLASIIFKIVFKKRRNTVEHNTQDFWHNKRSSAPFGAITGIVCGLLTVTVITVPIIGTLNLANDTIAIVEHNEKFIKGVKFNKTEFQILDKYANDEPVAAVYALGGEMFYDSIAYSYMNDEKMILRREVHNIDETMQFLGETLESLTGVSDLTSEKIEIIEARLEKLTNESPTFKMLAADFLSGAATTWLNGEAYLGLPSFGTTGLLSPIVNEMLFVCSQTTPDTVGEDLTTILNIILLATQNDLLTPASYNDIIRKIDENHILEKFCDELLKNKRMAYIADGISDISIMAVSYMLKYFNYADGQYESMIQMFTDTLNSVKSFKKEERIEKISEFTTEYIASLGVALPKDISTLVAEAMDTYINPADGTVRPSDVIDFFNMYTS